MSERIVALAGGVGGAKMAEGLLYSAPEVDLTVIVNTADDFDIYGLRVCPDLDTVMYTLAGIANPATGWGIEGDTRQTLDGIAAYGEEPWFLIGDRDFATDILRSAWLRDGVSLSEVTRRLAAGLGIAAAIVPMSDDPVATIVETPAGDLAFQDYFVRRRQEDEVRGVRFEGIEQARATPAAIAAIDQADLIVFCPSNPIVSLGPLLGLADLRGAIESRKAPAVAISPIIAGKALKGPADKMLSSLGHDASALGVARILRPFIDGFVIDQQDLDLVPAIEATGLPVRPLDTIMGGREGRVRLAREVIEFGRTLRTGPVLA